MGNLLLPLLLLIGLFGSRREAATKLEDLPQPIRRDPFQPPPTAARTSPPPTAARSPAASKRKAAPAPKTERDAADQAAVNATVTQAVRDDINMLLGKPVSPPVADTMPQQHEESVVPSSSARSSANAAKDLAAFLRRTKRFGSARDRPAEVQAAQRDLRVKDDGIVGPVTRAAAKKAGTTLPTK